MKSFYPIMIDIENKPCVVIGGGYTSYKKVSSLLLYRGKVTVISPKLCVELYELHENGVVKWVPREYKLGDLEDTYLVYGATNNREVNKEIFIEAKTKAVLVNIVDEIDNCEFIVPAVVKQGDLTIAISTNGKSPMLARKIKEDLKKVYGTKYEKVLEILGNLRQEIINEFPESSTRYSIFKELVYSNLLYDIIEEREEIIMRELKVVLQRHKK